MFDGSSATVPYILHTLKKYLVEAAVDAPATDARLLLCHVTGLTRLDLLRHPERVIDTTTLASLFPLLERRCQGEPMSRILGRKEFWSLELKISPDVLDPRPDTETLIDAVLSHIPPTTPLRILDLGTGSGAILIALLKEYAQAHGIGVDISPHACEIAKENVASHDMSTRAKIRCGSYWDALYKGEMFDLIVSNPPYIPTADLAHLEREASYDPEMALDGGVDGLEAYHTIAHDIRLYLQQGGWAALECGQHQGPAIAALFESSGLTFQRFWDDLSGITRGIILTHAPHP